MTERRVILVLSGPNLNLLGQREPEIYGGDNLEQINAKLQDAARREGLELRIVQSNAEGELIDAIQAARGRCAAIVINPAALGHYAWGLHDALAMFDGPVVELHISNPNTRESWRHRSVVAPVATGTIAGFGGHGYILAMEAVRRLLA